MSTIQRSGQKRNLTFNGRTRSVALEPDFWRALEALAASRNMSLLTLVGRVDLARDSSNLASSLRVFAMQAMRETALIAEPPVQNPRSAEQGLGAR